jgi:hypothetical protein
MTTSRAAVRPVGTRHVYPEPRRAVPVLSGKPAPTVSLSPLYATVTKNDGDPLRTRRSVTILCRGAIHCALFAQAPNSTTRNRRLPPAPRAHTHSEPKPFKRNAYKNKGVPVEP